MHAYSKCLLPDKGIGSKIVTPDFSVGCIEYKDVIARVTLSVVAPLDRSLLIVGDKGNLLVPDIRDDHSSVYIRSNPLSKLESALEHRINFQKRDLKNFLIFSHGIGGMIGGFIRKFLLLKRKNKLFQVNINLLISQKGLQKWLIPLLKIEIVNYHQRWH